MERYLCIHGHFYQPQRENPWLEAIELQESAYPYHDWNERITRECYGPMTQSRLLDREGRIERIANNYASISFNFGATLLSWLHHNAPRVYASILDADRRSRERFGGHGSAIAQGYHHSILPLCNDRDRRTQVLWGVRDFEHRFGRRPEGMWLPEAAVDIPTLEALAEQGIAFTILAPRQARRVRRLGGGRWTDVGGAIDPSMAYEQRLPSGRRIALFFYDGPVSQAIAFERLLDSGERFAQRLMEIYDDKRPWPQLAHVATDGESYGHHHRHGDMALAYALAHVERHGLATPTNYAQFLERHPPTHEVEIHENSSWSCVHGVERWRSDCGCNTGAHPGWNQAWRAPLREALDWLRDAVAPRYEHSAAELLRDPWAARDDYVRVLLDRSPENVERFLADHRARDLAGPERVRALKLLELQRHAMLMYTSCGWFFDELSGIETVQVIQYAARVVQLAEQLFGDRIEEEFAARLERAPSNLPEHGHGRAIYEKWARPMAVDLAKVAAHYALSAMFEDYEDRARIYCYDVERQGTRSSVLGRARLLIGRARLTSRITREAETFTYGVLHLGDHIIYAGVRVFGGDEAYAALVARAEQAFGRAEYTEVLRALDEAFGGAGYALRALFKDEQRRVIDRILSSTLAEIEGDYRQIYEHHAPLMRFLASLDVRAPRALRIPAEFVVNTKLTDAAEADPPDIEQMRAALDDARSVRVRLDEVGLSFTLENVLERQAARLREEPRRLDVVETIAALVGVVRDLPFEVDLSEVQNAYYPLVGEVLPQRRAGAERGDEQAAAWLETFLKLGESLRVRVDAALAPEPRP